MPDNRTPQEIGALFGAQIMGGTLLVGPPDPESRLGRMNAADRQLAAGEITQADRDQVLKALRLEILEQLAAEDSDD